MNTSAHVAGFLNPGSVAIVGASARGNGSYRAGGRAVLHHLLAYSYPGKILAVHPSATEIEGVPAYPSLADLPCVPECVVVAVPSERVRAVLEQCAAVGAPRALVITGGFGELGPDGALMERDIVDYARDHGIRLVGPNSTGLINVADRVAMSMTSVLTEGAELRPGGLAVVAQSGAVSSSIVERARAAGVGFAHIASIGNQVDLGADDFLTYFAEDPRVHAVSMYLESIRDRESISAGIARLRAAGKPVVALLGGRSARGEQAASSHTGKLLGRAQLELSLLESLGVHLVADPDDLWQLGAHFARRPVAERVERWGVFTYSGGMGVLAMDQLAEAGVPTPQFTAATQAHLREVLPGYVAPVNPLDIGSGAMPERFTALLQAVADDEGVDAVCVPLPMGAAGWHEPIVDGVLEVAESSGKPFVVCWYGGDGAREHLLRLRAAGIVTTETPTELGRLVAALTSPATGPVDTLGDAASRVDDARQVVGGAAALQTLADAGISVVPERVCDSADDAVAAASSLGYPVVVKSAAEHVRHRLELGLVKTGLETPDAVAAAVTEIGTALGQDAPVLVQRMVDEGHELVLAVRSAGTLGLFGGIGLGGSAVELLNDVRYFPLPCDEQAVRATLARLRGGDALLGFRGQESVDVGWLCRTMQAMSDCLSAAGFAEIEVNPAIVSSSGGYVVDALCLR